MHGENYKYNSVTQILGVLRKIGLENWFRYNTPEFIKRESEKAKTAGTDTHTVIQQCIEGEEMKLDTQYPLEVKTAVESFLKFKKENPQYVLKRAEVQLDCDKYGFSGKLDCVANDNEIVDWKTGHPNSKGKLAIYPEMVYQVSMYSIAYELQFNTKIKRATIVLFDKTSVDYIMRVVEREEIGEAFKSVCIPAIKIFNYGRKK